LSFSFQRFFLDLFFLYTFFTAYLHILFKSSLWGSPIQVWISWTYFILYAGNVCEVSILQHKNFIVWLEFPLYFEETNMQENIRARDLKKFRIYCSPVAALRLLNPFVFINCIYIWKMLHETHEQNFPFQWSPLCDIQRKSDGKIFHVRKIDYFAIPINISD